MTDERIEAVADSAWPAIVGSESRVRVLGGATRRYVHLDNAASKPALVAVQETVNELMPSTRRCIAAQGTRAPSRRAPTMTRARSWRSSWARIPRATW